MKKIFIAFQFLVIILIGIYAVYTISRPEPPPNYNPESWHSWEGFFVLSYAGVTSKGENGYISQKQLKEQLNALKKAGYNTIAPQDAAAFLENRSPLPEKAVLLLFEGDRKDSFLYSTPILQNFGMIGAMCVPTSFTNTRGDFYLKESDLRKLSGQPNWRLCSMGVNAVNEISVNDSGSKGHFLTRRMWTGKGLEDDAAFKKRVTDDYAESAHLLERAGGKKIEAYLYPFADAGTGSGSDPHALEINREAVATYYKIAFTSADDPFNGPYDKPFNLNRLRVGKDWDGPRLVQELQNFLPRLLPAEGFSDKDWFKKGNTRPDGNMLTLSPGSVVWLRGSDDWSDLDVTLKARLASKASLSLIVRYEGTDSFLGLTTTQGNLLLNERTGTTSQTLSRTAVKPGDGESNLRLKVKGTRAWVWYDDRSISDPIPLSPSIGRGRIGISCRDGEVQLLAFHAVRLPSVFAFADGYRSLPASAQQEISAVLPPWFSQGVTPNVTARQRIDLLTAASSGVKTIPVIETKKDMPAEAAENFAKAIVFSLERQSVKPLVTHFAVYGLGRNLPETLHKYGYRLIRILSPEEALRFTDKKQIINGDMLLINGYGGEMKGTVNHLLHFVPPGRLIVLTGPKSDLPTGVGRAVTLASGTTTSTR